MFNRSSESGAIKKDDGCRMLTAKVSTPAGNADNAEVRAVGDPKENEPIPLAFERTIPAAPEDDEEEEEEM